ncbi:MAG: septum site-determining protein MinD [Clostridia bacterium]|nr:septum site-determining protein MinD [Clostridia bacterium]
MARKIVITSGKGGVGKTTLTASLGYKLARLGMRVALVDMDLGLNNLDVTMGIENRIVFDLLDVVEGRCRVKQALIQHEELLNLYIMPNCHFERKTITAHGLKEVIGKMSELFDFILLDCPAGVDIGFHRSVVCADEAIVVTTPHITSIRDSDKVAGILKTYELNAIYSVVNRLRGDLVASGEMVDAYEIFDMLKLKPLGIIPESDNINLYNLSDLDGASGYPYEVLAGNLLDGTGTMLDCTQRYSGFIGRIRRNLKRNA